MKITAILMFISFFIGCKGNRIPVQNMDSSKTSIAPKILTASDSANVEKSVDSELRALNVGGIIGEGWDYDTSIDEMRGTKTIDASTWSKNKIQFDFPYQGGSYTEILLTKHSSKSNVILSVTKGQFNTSIDGVTIAAKFDDSPIQNYRGLESDNGRSDLLFIEPAARFIAQLKNSHHLIIEAPFYQEGRQQIEFNVEGLKW